MNSESNFNNTIRLALDNLLLEAFNLLQVFSTQDGEIIGS